MSDQTNAEVSDERVREIEQAILLLRPAGNIAYNMKHPGAVSPNAGGAAYEFGRINDAVNAAIKLLSSARRSVTSQASEGAGEPVGYVSAEGLKLLVEGYTCTAVAPAVADELFNRPLYASPSKRVERLEAALKPFADVLDEGEGIEGVVLTFTAPDGHQVVTAVPGGAFQAARQALQGDRS